MTRRTLWLDDGIWARLVALAKRDGLTVSDLIRRAIIELLRKEE